MPKKTSSATRSTKQQTPKTQSKDFHLELLNTAQKLAWAAFQQHDVLFLLGPAGTGKAQPLSAKIMTPSGQKNMGDIQVGDTISTPDGNSARVGGVFPQGKKPIYRITFSDGTATECCDEHLWKISSITDGWKDKVVDTKFIRENHRSASGRRKYHISTTAPVHHNRRSYKIAPYSMGILLGDGCLKGNKPAFTTTDACVASKVHEEIAEDYKLWHDGGIEYAIVKKEKSNRPNLYTESLRSFDLMGCDSKSKFIPKEYLFGAVDQRIQLLQGLMDSYGTVDKRSGQPSFSTSSPRLADDFCQLIQSLGGVAKVSVKETSHSHNYVISVCLPNEIAIFNLGRKARLRKMRSKYFPKRYIDRVEYVDEKESQCIYVESEDHLYLTNNYIVTHNTFLATAFGIKTFLAKECSKIVLTRPIVEAGEKIGFLPGDFEAKVNPYMMPMYDCMDKLVGREGAYREKVLAGCEVAPLAFMRGRSQPLDSKILTPTGYCLMGDIQVGDMVIGKNGTPTQVVQVYPQGDLDVYKMTFSDGATVECSADHLWDTMTLSEKRHNKGFTSKTTAEIMKKLKVNRQFNHRIPICSPVFFSDQPELPIDPYVLGVMLGDGNLSKDAAFTLTSVDDQIVTEVKRRLPGYRLVASEKREEFAPSYRLVRDQSEFDLRSAIKIMGLEGAISQTKFVPDNFKTAGASDRLTLLRGLLDTDGCCFRQKGKRKPRVQFYSTSETLARDVVFLVNSLGGTAVISKRDSLGNEPHLLRGRIIKHNTSVWVVGIRMLENPFLLERKAMIFEPLQPIRTITSVEKMSRKPCQCIQVDRSDHLYLTDHCVVTHNTFDDAVCLLDEAQNCSMPQLKMFLSRFADGSKIVVTGDPNQSDLQGPCALSECVRKLSELPGVGIVEFKKNSIVRHPLIGSILERLGD